jgi:hypothetical protein
MIAELSPNSNSRKRLTLKPNLDTERSLLAFLFEEINVLKMWVQLKPEKTASSKKRKEEG